MKPKTNKILKGFSLFLCFLLCFQQTGLAQVTAELNIASHLARMTSNLTVDKFRPIHLRYLQYLPQDNSFKLYLDKGDSANATNTTNAAKELLKYFYIGLTLPNDKFWVNLRPDSEGQIIDSYIEKTDVGRIMLEADLQLKKDTASMTSPNTPEGREYWNKLYEKAEELYGYDNVTIPTLTRPWIVPGEIIIRETADAHSAYIYKATLKVMLEQDYLKNSQPSAFNYQQDYSFKDVRAKALNEYSTQLIKKLIIPKLTKEVNSSKRYAPLRQIYYSLIMAQWFKVRFKSNSTNATNPASLINSQDLTNLISQDSWSKTEYFRQYQKSFTEGEYNIQEPVYTPYGQSIRSYFSGGMQLGLTGENAIPGFGDRTDASPPIKLIAGQGEPELRPELVERVIRGEVASLPPVMQEDKKGSSIPLAEAKERVDGLSYLPLERVSFSRQGEEFFSIRRQILFGGLIFGAAALMGLGIPSEAKPQVPLRVSEEKIASVVAETLEKLTSLFEQGRLTGVRGLNDASFWEKYTELNGEDTIRAAQIYAQHHNVVYDRIESGKTYQAHELLRMIAREIRQAQQARLDSKDKETITIDEIEYIILERRQLTSKNGEKTIGVLIVRPAKASAEMNVFAFFDPRLNKLVIVRSETERFIDEVVIPAIRGEDDIRVWYEFEGPVSRQLRSASAELIRAVTRELNSSDKEELVRELEQDTIRHEGEHAFNQGQFYDLSALKQKIRSIFARLGNNNPLEDAVTDGARKVGDELDGRLVELTGKYSPLGLIQMLNVLQGATVNSVTYISLAIILEELCGADFFVGINLKNPVAIRRTAEYIQELARIGAQERLKKLKDAAISIRSKYRLPEEQVNLMRLMRNVLEAFFAGAAEDRSYALEASFQKPESLFARETGATKDAISSAVEIDKKGSSSSPAAGREEGREEKIEPSPLFPGSMPPAKNNTGGIDFRSLPIVTQAVSNLRATLGTVPLGMVRDSILPNDGGKMGQSPSGTVPIFPDLEKEWQVIERMTHSGVSPSAERLKEFIRASCYNGDTQRSMQKVILCIADILRQEEERASQTDPALRDILVVLEAMRNTHELRQVFLGKTG